MDYESITLMQKLIIINEEMDKSNIFQSGFSNASRYDKINHQGNNKKSISYIIINVQIVGIDSNKDEVMEFGLLKVNKDEIKDQFRDYKRRV